jgi:hypothetical protein
MVSMSDEPKERNILKLILIVRFTCATLDVGHHIITTRTRDADNISDVSIIPKSGRHVRNDTGRWK